MGDTSETDLYEEWTSMKGILQRLPFPKWYGKVFAHSLKWVIDYTKKAKLSDSGTALGRRLG